MLTEVNASSLTRPKARKDWEMLQAAWPEALYAEWDAQPCLEAGVQPCDDGRGRRRQALRQAEQGLTHLQTPLRF